MVKRQRVTIKEVAKEAGVSPSTVSRVISNNPRISKETTEKGLQIPQDVMVAGFYP